MFTQHYKVLDTIEWLSPKLSFWAVLVDQSLLAYVQGFGPQLHRMKQNENKIK